jgi:hypothetical protein
LGLRKLIFENETRKVDNSLTEDDNNDDNDEGQNQNIMMTQIGLYLN